MEVYNIQIGAVEQLEKLVDIVRKFPCDVNLVNDLGCVDCKSRLGVLRMGLSKRLKLEVIGSREEAEALVKELSEEFPVSREEAKRWRSKNNMPYLS